MAFNFLDGGFFNQRAQDYQGYAIPQLDRQFGEEQRSLAYKLADAGLTRSSAAAKTIGDLEREYTTNRQQIVDQASDYARQARGDVEGARSNLIGMAQATGDSSAVGNAAVNQSAQIASAPAFSPLGQLFANVGSTIYDARQRQLSDAVRGAGGAKLFATGSNTGSGRVVNA